MEYKELSAKLDFEVDAGNGIVLRDAISFSSISELRNTSKEEREALIQERYDNFLAALAPTNEAYPEAE